MSSSPHPVTAQQVTEADFRAARNVAFGCLSALEDLGFASGDLGSLIYRPSLFTCDEFTMLPLDPGFSRITRDVSYLCQVLDYAGGLRPGPLAGHQVDWNDAQGPEKIGKVKPWLVQVAEGPAWRGCTTAHEKAYHLALDLWLQIEGIVFSEVFDGGGEYEPGPGFHLKPGLVEENLTEIQDRIKARPRLDHHAAKAEVDRESVRALAAWKTDRNRESAGEQADRPARGGQKGNAKKKGPSLRDQKIAKRFAAGYRVNAVCKEFGIRAANARKIKSRNKALIARLKAELGQSQPL